MRRESEGDGASLAWLGGGGGEEEDREGGVVEGAKHYSSSGRGKTANLLLVRQGHGLGGQPLEAVHGNVLDNGHQLLLVTALTISLLALALAQDSETEGSLADTLPPHGLVQLGINLVLGGSHLLGHELLDGLDGVRSTLGVLSSMNSLVDVDGELTSHLVIQCLPLLLLLTLCHDVVAVGWG